MALTTTQRNTLLTSLVSWATTNHPELTDSAARQAFRDAVIGVLDAHRTSSLAGRSSTTVPHFQATYRKIFQALSVSTTIKTAVDNHAAGS